MSEHKNKTITLDQGVHYLSLTEAGFVMQSQSKDKSVTIYTSVGPRLAVWSSGKLYHASSVAVHGKVEKIISHEAVQAAKMLGNGNGPKSPNGWLQYFRLEAQVIMEHALLVEGDEPKGKKK